MSIPNHGSSITSKLAGTVQWSDSLGTNTPYDITQIDGLDLPAIRSGDTPLVQESTVSGLVLT